MYYVLIKLIETDEEINFYTFGEAPTTDQIKTILVDSYADQDVYAVQEQRIFKGVN